MYKIEHDVDIPEYTVGRSPKYPFKQLEPGDSFVAPKICRNAAYVFAKRTGTKFKTRTINDEYIRVWRVE